MYFGHFAPLNRIRGRYASKPQTTRRQTRIEKEPPAAIRFPFIELSASTALEIVLENGLPTTIEANAVGEFVSEAIGYDAERTQAFACRVYRCETPDGEPAYAVRYEASDFFYLARPQ